MKFTDDNGTAYETLSVSEELTSDGVIRVILKRVPVVKPSLNEGKKPDINMPVDELLKFVNGRSESPHPDPFAEVDELVRVGYHKPWGGEQAAILHRQQEYRAIVAVAVKQLETRALPACVNTLMDRLDDHAKRLGDIEYRYDVMREGLVRAVQTRGIKDAVG